MPHEYILLMLLSSSGAPATQLLHNQSHEVLTHDPHISQFIVQPLLSCSDWCHSVCWPPPAGSTRKTGYIQRTGHAIYDFHLLSSLLMFVIPLEIPSSVQELPLSSDFKLFYAILQRDVTKICWQIWKCLLRLSFEICGCLQECSRKLWLAGHFQRVCEFWWEVFFHFAHFNHQSLNTPDSKGSWLSSKSKILRFSSICSCESRSHTFSPAPKAWVHVLYTQTRQLLKKNIPSWNINEATVERVGMNQLRQIEKLNIWMITCIKLPCGKHRHGKSVIGI